MSPSLKSIQWRLICSSILALVLAIGSFSLNQWFFSYSDDQCFWKAEGNKVTIQEILPNGVAEKAGLLEGDELVAIQDKKITARTLPTATRIINEQPEGQVLLYTVYRNGKLLSLPVKLVKPFNYVGLSMLLAGLVAWGIGLLVVLSSPQRKVARHFFYLGVISLLVPLYSRGATGNVPIYVLLPTFTLAGVILSIAPPLWLHFFLRFPHPFVLRTNRIFLLCLYVTFVFMGGVSTLAFLARTLVRAGLLGDPIGFTSDLQALIALFHGLSFATILAGVAVFWLGAFKLPDRRRRALLPALILTTFICMDLGLYSYLSAMAQGKSLLFQREAWIFFSPLPLLPLSFAYAILRHGFLEVRRAILRWLTYFMVLGIALAAYLWGLAWIFEQGSRVIPAAWVGILAGLSALPIGWLLRWLLQVLRKKFRRDLHTARDLILDNLRDPKKRFSEAALLHGLATSLQEAFHPQVLRIIPVKDRSLPLPPLEELDPEETYAGALSQEQHLRLPAYVVRNARYYGELVVGLGSDESDWIREQGLAVRAHVDALEAQVMVILLVSQEPHTAVMLGGKYAELNYGRDDRDLLREVAVSAGILLETAVLHRRLVDQGRIEHELQTARHIQESLITSEPPSIPGYSLALRLEPALETGGDLLWVTRRSQGKWLAAVGDVSGKGLPAALYMSQSVALLKFVAQQEDMDFDQMLPVLDHTMRNLMGSRDFLTLCLLEWNERGQYRVARAGHPPPLLVKGSGPRDILGIAPRGRGLGMRPSMPATWEIHEADLQPGEWIVMYSDGFTEAMNDEGEEYGLERFQLQLRRHWASGSVRSACDGIYRDVARFETQNRDDRTLFILGRLGG